MHWPTPDVVMWSFIFEKQLNTWYEGPNSESTDIISITLYIEASDVFTIHINL